MDSTNLVKTILANTRHLSDDEVTEVYTYLAGEFSERQALTATTIPALISGEAIHAQAVAMRERRARGELEGLATGYRRLDQASGGWREGELIVVGASSAVGKTNFVINCFHNMAMNGITTLFLSLEMSNLQVYDRMIGLHTSPIIGGTEEQVPRLPMFYKPADYNSPALLHALIRYYVTHAPHIKCVAIDHLTLLPSLHTDRRLSHAAWVQKLREWVKEFNIPIVLIHHLRRQAKDNDNPQLVDLAESQDIVNHADQIILLQRDTEHTVNRRYLHLMLKKNRNGGMLHRDVYSIDEHYKLAEVDTRNAQRLMQQAATVFNIDV